jgi:outer membrane protein OmpA-like peptidoglycan-associated protein
LRASRLTRRSARESEANAVADGKAGAVGPARDGDAATLTERGLAAVGRAGDGGKPVPADARASIEARTGVDLTEARVHDDPRAAVLARSAGAQAITIGPDMYFGAGRYDPRSASGRRLLAHELAHVAQHRGGEGAQVDGDLAMSLPVPQGVFEMGMSDYVGAAARSRAGLTGTIRFVPDPHASYTADLELLQVVTTTDLAGATTPHAGDLVDWTNVNHGEEAPRNAVGATGLGAAPRGQFVDVLYDPSQHPEDSETSPYYQPDYYEAGANEPGWIRSSTDSKASLLTDDPGASYDSRMDFETVAKGADNEQVYGSLRWGFEIHGGRPGAEYAHATGAASPAVQESLRRFRAYFTHEPMSIGFDTDADEPLSGEQAKVEECARYALDFPDVSLTIGGYADERGSDGHNLDLSLRRAERVKALLVGLGVADARMSSLGMGATHRFGGGRPGPQPFAQQPFTAQPGQPARTAGTLQANRRVEIQFARNASSAIPGP